MELEEKMEEILWHHGQLKCGCISARVEKLEVLLFRRPSIRMTNVCDSKGAGRSVWGGCGASRQESASKSDTYLDRLLMRLVTSDVFTA